MSRVSCAVVGLGQGMENLYCAVSNPRFEIRAVCDVDAEPYGWITGTSRPEDSERDTASFPSTRTWVGEIRKRLDGDAVEFVPEYKDLLRRDDIQAIMLVVPDVLHESYTVQALEAGKYVLCTKPMALTVEESLRVGRAAQAHPGHYMVSFQMTYSPFVRTVLDTIESGKIGEVHQIRFDYHRRPWRPAHSTMNAPVDGSIIKEGTHWLDMFYRLGGQRPWRAVSAFGANDVLGRQVEFEDNGVLIVDYDGLRVAHTFSYFRRSKKREDILVVGDKGTLRGDLSRLFVESDDLEEVIDVPGHAIPHLVHDGYEAMVDQFARVVLDGEDPYSNWRTGCENMLTCHAAQIATMDGRTVRREELSAIDWRLVLDEETPGRHDIDQHAVQGL